MLGKKYFFTVIILIFLLNIVHAVSMGISKSELDFYGNLGEKVCKKIYLYSNSETGLISEDKWSMGNSRKLSDYKYSSNDFNIIIEYPHNISIYEKKEINVCIIGNQDGRYYGVLIYKQPKMIGVGTWLDITIGNGINPNKPINQSIKNNIISLIGFTVNDENNKVSINRNILVLNLIFLTAILLLLLIYLKRKNIKIIS